MKYIFRLMNSATGLKAFLWSSNETAIVVVGPEATDAMSLPSLINEE